MTNEQNKNKLEIKRISNKNDSFEERKSINLSRKGFLKASIPVIALAVVALFATLKNHGCLF
ncbi:hypothetical protein [Priestia megaterium]|uniref:hypothetical protein n=1 Tax=Priestia megaterium TaxID=1404 RepID=UPI00159C5855|nr:hypothetical protein [Priestia megaterium]